MVRDNEHRLFNRIAPVYGLFFELQRKKYSEVIESVINIIDVGEFQSIVDIGCGTGALCSILFDKGLKVTGIEPAIKMLNISEENNKDKDIKFLQADITKGLSFVDNQFDIAISSYVAHGLSKEDRVKMYKEMARVAKFYVIIHDYNSNRSMLTDIVEYLERGDYFNFIRTAKNEMKDCVEEMKSCFQEVRVVDVGKKAAWYICKVR